MINPEKSFAKHGAEPAAPVVVVGAGLAGLQCARTLHEQGHSTILLEASDGIGGRVRTDIVDGHRLDRGFQVLLTAYPEARRSLDLDALQLESFYPGALIQVGHERYRFADPWRKPFASLAALAAPVATLRDGLRIARVRARALRSLGARKETRAESTYEYLLASGLTERVIDRFFRPFFGGVFLDRELGTQRWFFEFVFAMFARGHATLPAGGMGSIANQLAAALPPSSIRIATPVTKVDATGVRTAAERIAARAVVLAVDADAAAKLLPGLPRLGWNGTTTAYYAAPRPPIDEAILLLNGNGTDLVNHVCVPSEVCKEYAPEGSALVSVSIVGVPELEGDDLDSAIRSELESWFGDDVEAWRLLRIYRIRHALPQIQPKGSSGGDSTAVRAGIFVCGDHRTDPSIDGALRSGRETAEEVIRSFRENRRHG